MMENYQNTVQQNKLYSSYIDLTLKSILYYMDKKKTYTKFHL